MSDLSPVPLSETTRHLALLQRLSLAVNTSVLQDDIFDAIGLVLRDFFEFDGLTLAILAPNLQGIGRVIHIDRDGFADTQSEHHRYTGTDPLLEPVLSYRNTPFFLTPQENSASILLPNYRCHALVYPVFTKRQPVGILVMNRHERFEAFTAEELALLEVGLPLLALALEQARLYSDMQMLMGRQFLMNHLSVKIRQSLELTQILKTAANEVGQVLGVSRCTIHAFHAPIPLNQPLDVLTAPVPETTPYLYTLAGAGPYQASPHYSHPYGFEWQVLTRQASAQEVLQSQLKPFFFFQDGKPFQSGWVAPKAFYDENQLQSLAVVPIVTHQEWVGSISLHQCNKVRVWLNEDKEMLCALSEQLALAMTQAQLFSKINAQKDALTRTLDELQQTQMHLVQSEKMAMLGQFVAGIAHEVNTPLGTMLANTQTLEKVLEKFNPEIPPEAKYLKMAHDILSLNRLAGERIKDTVVNLRNFARLDESELKTVDIHEGLESTLLLMKHSLQDHLVIERAYDREHGFLKCFPGLLNQVFMNLMVNATHALEGRENPILRIETQLVQDVALGDCLQVSVVDNGKGIAEEHLSKLFDPGFTTKSRGVGTGLGLALCFRIVEKHRGRIDVHSSVNVGTRFDVIIPRT
jgi:signal transduction histidine kinase